MNIIAKITNHIIEVLKPFVRDAEIVLEAPKQAAFGDFSTNAALKSGGRKKAEEVVANLQLPTEYIEKAEVAGPGFINFYLNDKWLAEVPTNVLEKGVEYGQNDALSGKKINLEYVSANPTGPMHMGNARGGALGDSLARIMALSGAQVTREFYLNDAGNQIAKLSESLYARYLEVLAEREGEECEYQFPEDGYQGADIKELAERFIDEIGEVDVDSEGIIKDQIAKKLTAFALEQNVAEIQRILGNYRVEYDMWFRESTLHESGAIKRAMDMLSANGKIYEKDGALWLCSPDEDEKDEVLVRANGVPTYFAADIAYHYNKLVERGFDLSIDVWGADHHGHIARVKCALEALGVEPSRFEVITVQLVRLMRGNEVARMSKRKGETISLGDLLEEIGIDAARYFFNMRKADSHFDFDLDLAVRKSNDNPVFYVQYAHARICSILENVKAAGAGAQNIPSGYDIPVSEKELLRKIAEFPQEVAICARTWEPSRLTHYASDLAAKFHSFYGECRVMVDDETLKNWRVSVVEAAQCTLANVLGLLGVSAPKKM